MKKFLLIAGALVAASAASAEARTNISVGIGVPAAPVYYQPAPVYYAPRPVYYQPAPAYYYAPPAVSVGYYNGWERHRNYNWGYWHDRDRGYDHGRGGWRH